jgi:hypothetical protein
VPRFVARQAAVGVSLVVLVLGPTWILRLIRQRDGKVLAILLGPAKNARVGAGRLVEVHDEVARPRARVFAGVPDAVLPEPWDLSKALAAVLAELEDAEMVDVVVGHLAEAARLVVRECGAPAGSCGTNLLPRQPAGRSSGAASDERRLH